MTKRKRVTPTYAWAGFVDGKIDLELWPDTGNDKYCRLYKTRNMALSAYDDVRRVRITEVK